MLVHILQADRLDRVPDRGAWETRGSSQIVTTNPAACMREHVDSYAEYR